ncbi:MAG: hypothetical protein IJS78_02515, partial [Clostridia bacterium]|nr:hypothetical protein [Clostridia bacterium]
MKSAFFRKAASVVVAAFTLMTVVAAVPSASANPANDPTPENIGVLTTKSGIDVSTLQVIGENGSPITAVGGLGSHGGHETRLVRTEYGTYVSYITEHIKREDIPANDTDHEHWGNGIAVFKIMKITSEGSHVIFTGEYPKANGSCTPNVLNAGDGKLYVTILCENPDRYYETMGTPEFTNSGWYTVYEVDMTTDNVTNVASTKFDYPTSPLDDHGYGYTQPILDREHGKLYALACGGEAPGFLAWNILDLNTMTWDPTCHCVQLFARYCYINGYPDGKGGFTVVIERDAPSSALAEAIGCTFTSDGYFFDAVNIMHVPDPTVDALEDHVVWEPNYKPGGNNFQASASHYGSGGCTYLDNEGRLHVIYSVTYFTTPTSRTTKVSGVYHAVFDLDGNEIYNELIPTALLDKNGTKTYSGPNGFVMTQAWDGTYYIFLLWGGTTGTKLEAWSSPSSDGIEFTRAFKDVPLKTADGVSPADGTHPIIANSRNFSVRDGIAAIIFHTGGSAGDPYYYFSVKLDEPVPHDHVWVETVTEPTCANEGYTVKVCSICGERIIDDRTPALGHEWGEWTVTVEPTEQATGVRERVCSRCGATDSEELPPVAHVHDYVAV